MDPQALIAKAIENRHLVSFILHGLPRIAEPHLLGEHAGRVQVLVFQVGGSSSSGSLPHWRRVDLADITELRMLVESFTGPRTDSFPNWDRVIARVS
jgi:hypothetical protein